MPTALERAGNCSQTFGVSGNMVLVADPLTARQLPDGSYTRDVFSGNVILPSRISKVAANVAPV